MHWKDIALHIEHQFTSIYIRYNYITAPPNHPSSPRHLTLPSSKPVVKWVKVFMKPNDLRRPWGRLVFSSLGLGPRFWWKHCVCTLKCYTDNSLKKLLRITNTCFLSKGIKMIWSSSKWMVLLKGANKKQHDISTLVLMLDSSCLRLRMGNVPMDLPNILAQVVHWFPSSTNKNKAQT